MIRLLSLLFEDSMTLVYLLPSLIFLIFSFVIARFCVRKFQNGASNLMMIGVVIQGIQFIYSQSLRGFLLDSIGHESIALLYGLNTLFYFVAHGLFLYGVWKLVKGFAELQEEESTNEMGGLFLKK